MMQLNLLIMSFQQIEIVNRMSRGNPSSQNSPASDSVDAPKRFLFSAATLTDTISSTPQSSQTLLMPWDRWQAVGKASQKVTGDLQYEIQELMHKILHVSNAYKVFGEVVTVFIFCDYKWPRVALYKANFPGYLNAYFYPLC